jgi:predicted dehydrogenase
MKKYKWGIIGPGSISKRFVGGLATLPNALLYAVGSRDIGRARAYAAEYGFEKAYGSYAELIGDPGVEAVYVATPHPQHEEAVIACLDGGKAVICEKPFAANALQAGRMIECARRNGVFLMEGMWTRYLPAIRKVRELVAEGAIGRVLHVCADFGFRAGVNPEGRLFAPAAAGGSLMDIGVYNVSFYSMIFGKQPDRIQSQMSIGSTGVDESASAIFHYEGGQSASVFSAIRVTTAQDASIFGEDGYIKLPAYWHGDTIHLNNKEGAREIRLPFESTGFQYEAAELMSCLGGGLLESQAMPHCETLSVMRTLDKIRFDNNLRYPFECGRSL